VVATPPTPAGGYLGTPAATAPAAPTIGTASAGNTSATVTWTAPANTGGSSITGYTVQAFAGTATTPVQTVTAAGTATTTTVTGLINGTSYTFIVSATNAVGTGPASARSNAVTPAAAVTVPGAPTLGAVTAGNASATVSWAAPASNGGSAITRYDVRVFAGTTLSKTVSALASPTLVPGLTNGRAYTFDVAARNATGVGAVSARSAPVIPAAATTTTASVTPTAVSFDSQAVGTTSAPVAVTVKNTGTGPLTISSITTSGPFAAASTTCPVGGSVAPGASCVVNVVARPTAAGDMIGTLTIVDNTAGGPEVVDLDGWGE
jgi:hypothetical protein